MKFRLPSIRQHYTGKNIGGLIDTYQRSVGIVGAIQYIAVVIILYTTSLRPFLSTHLPWMSFGVYIAVAFTIMLGIMVVSYIIGAPSSFAYWNHQIWKHDNPQRAKLERLEYNQKKIMEKLGINESEDK